MTTTSKVPEGEVLASADGETRQVPVASNTKDETTTDSEATASKATTSAASPLETANSAAPVEAPTVKAKTLENPVLPSSDELAKMLDGTGGKETPSGVVPLPLDGTTSGNKVNLADFKGTVDTNDEIPSQQVLRTIETYTVFGRDGKSHPFKSLYAGHNVARRVLVIFIRHFFCGSCQEYIRLLSASITPEALLGLPVSTFITVVGCGSPKLIDAYVEQTKCAFPVYADPTCKLYQELGMTRTLSLGARPAYLQNTSLAHSIVSGLYQGLKQVKTGLALQAGEVSQVGGEFLFEPASKSLETPISSPIRESGKELGTNDGETGAVEEKCVTWCHRMRTTRDHVEIPELMEVLGIQGDGQPIGDAKKWQTALKSRKGTGLSLASQMSQRSSGSAQIGETTAITT
ncbi:hypothetical protein GGS20DRAFT_558465 [Poronia punctata]|nr:hypothetical protein GGS20DRAFT_558465 [Poronia punctata]